MFTDEQLGHYLGLIYDTVQGNEGWLAFLEDLHRHTPQLQYQLNETDQNFMMKNFLAPTAEERFLRKYADSYHSVEENPFNQKLNLPIGQFYNTQNTISEETMLSSSVFLDVLKPQNYSFACFLPLARNDNERSNFTVTFDHRRDKDTISELTPIMNTLGPHMVRAISLRNRIRDAKEDLQRARMDLDSRATPMFFCDRDGRICLANKKAEELLSEGNFVKKGSFSQLTTADPQMANQLAHLIRKASLASLDPVAAYKMNVTTTIKIRSAESQCDSDHYIAQIEPKPSFSLTEFASMERKACVLVTLKRARPGDAIDTASLISRFGISRSESMLVPHIINGLTSQEIADELGKSKRTIDNQVRSMLFKLGIQKRASLVSRIADDWPM